MVDFMIMVWEVLCAFIEFFTIMFVCFLVYLLYLHIKQTREEKRAEENRKKYEPKNK